jgi:soluble lytic murein transglycosylase-like protein
MFLLNGMNGGSRCLAPEPADVVPLQELIAKRAYVLQTKLDSSDAQEMAVAATEVGREFGLSPVFVIALIEVESRYDKRAKSKKGCRGLIQLSKRTSKYLVDKFKIVGDPFYDIGNNIYLGIAYLAELIGEQRNLLKALTIYNKGYGNWINNPRISGYTHMVTKRFRYLKTLVTQDNGLICKK